MPRNKIEALSFREMAVADLASVQMLDQQSFINPWPEGAFHYELTGNQLSVCWVAEVMDENGMQIVASAVIWVIIDEAHLAMLAVTPQYRGLGIARRLLACALLVAFERGARKSLLEVRKNNIDALHLYYGFGYELAGIRPGYYLDNHEDALLLTLDPLSKSALENLTIA